MCERGGLAREVFERLVDVLKTAYADGTAPQATPPGHNDEAATTITPPRVQRTPAEPTKVPGGDGAKLSAMQRSIDELRYLFLGSCDDPQDGSRMVRGKALIRRSSSRAATITRQPVSVPRKPEVAFLARDKTRSSANA